MSRIVFYPYKMASRSKRDLVNFLRHAETQRNRRIFSVFPDRRYRPRIDDVIVNWGNSTIPTWDYSRILNKPEAVQIASNKLAALQKLTEHDIRTVPFTTVWEEAREWPQIVERHLLNASGGRGIVISTPETIGRARLYTQLLTPAEEYRVHIFKGECIDYIKKVHRTADPTPANGYVKNHDNGWYFIRNMRPREGVVEMAKRSVEALGLDFGAVDIIRHDGRRYVLEVNTAPGLSGIGIEAYSNAILNI